MDYDKYERPAPQGELMTKKDKKQLFIVSGIIGICVILFHYLGVLCGKVIAKTSLIDYYLNSESMSNIIQIFYSLISIVLPFYLGLVVLRKVLKKDELLPLGKPKSGKLFAASLGIGFLALVVSNYVTTFFVLGMEGFGFKFDSFDSPAPTTVSGFLWMTLSTAIVPALMEEFAIRGVIMQSLRKFGDSFAIIVSAIIFSLMHGNMVQAPFAFLLGLVMGWLVIVTDSLWTGIALHFMNNFYATVLSTVSENCSQTVYMTVIIVLNAIGIIGGIIALLWVIDKYKHKLKFYEPGGNTTGTRATYRAQAMLYTLISPTMIAALIILFVAISRYVHFGG